MLRKRGVEAVAVCFINSYANPENERRMREILEEELPGVEHLDLERRPAGDLRARALLDDGRERRALAAHRRLRAAAAVAPRGGRLRRRRPAAALRRRRDDAEDGREAGRPARLLGHRRRRDREPPRRDAVRLRELDRPRHGRHEHRHLARLPGPGADHEGVVRRVRLPDLLPVDRGADDRRRRRLAGLDRRSRLAAQRPAVGRRQPGPGLLPARQRPGRPTPMPTSCSAASARS